VQEIEAELFAHLLLGLTRAADRDPVPADDLSDEQRRLIEVLERG
jgi:hypothetical protein